MDDRDFYTQWGRWIIILLVAIPLYVWSWNATEIDLPRLIIDAPKARNIITDLVQPSLFARGEQTQIGTTPLQVPCDNNPPQAQPSEGDATITLSSNCLNAGDVVTVQGTGFRPNTQGRLYWQVTGLEGIGDLPARLRDVTFTTDAQGNFTLETEIPRLLEQNPGEHRVIAQATWTAGGLRPSEPLRITIDKMIETVFLALMATTFAGIIAVPLSFLGARNIMPDTRIGNTVYYITRTFFNTMRSIEPLILATIFAIWVGFGPFAGVLALTVFTIANIGKLYSEAAEDINPGPIEAIRATGASELEVIIYGVVPQIIPPYISFTVYHWDINVRMSTIIGFVGGGGIGLELRRWINQTQWHSAATAVWAIVVVVWAMDYASAIVRERLS